MSDAHGLSLNVRYFAHIRQVVGRDAETLALPEGATVADAVAALTARYPGLEALLPATRVAVDLAFVADGHVVRDGQELVLIPPVSGGSGASSPERVPRAALTHAPLDAAAVAAVEALVRSPRHGALVTFVGDVRDHARGRDVTDLHYEAYEPMAVAQLEALCAEVERDVPDARVAVHHRVGHLSVGDTAVVVAAGSPHRAEAFRACQRLIDRLKEDVPIWKREVGPGGDEWVSDRP